MSYGLTNNKKVLAYLLPLLFAVTFLCALLPWYWTAVVLCLVVVGFIFLAKYELGIYALIFVIVVGGTQPHLIFRCPWSTVVDRLSVLLLCFLLAILCRYILERFLKVDRGQSWSLLPRFLVFLFFWAAITLFWVPNIKHSLVQYSILGYNLLLFFLLVYFIDHVDIHKRVMWCLIISGIAAAVTGFILRFQELIVYNVTLQKGMILELMFPGGQRRLIAMGWSSNELALILNFVISIATGMMIVEKKRFTKIMLGSAIIFMMFAVIFTMSKGGLLGFIAMSHFIIFAFALPKNRLFRSISFLYLVFLSLLGLQRILLQTKRPLRILTFTGKASFSFTTRLNLWAQGIKKFVDSLGLGMGVGNFNYYTRQAPHAHNIYLDYIFDFGFIGAIFVFCVVLYFIRYTFKALKFKMTYLQVMRLSAIGGLIAIAVHGCVDFGYNITAIWLFITLSAATFYLSEKESDGLIVTSQLNNVGAL
jgi:O-antigen ligase